MATRFALALFAAALLAIDSALPAGAVSAGVRDLHQQILAPQAADGSGALLSVSESVTATPFLVAPSSISYSGYSVSQSISVHLSAAPSGPVTVALAASGFALDKCTLSFTAANWNADQTVQLSLITAYFGTSSLNAKYIGGAANPLSGAVQSIPISISNSVGASCTVFSLMHVYTFDNLKYDYERGGVTVTLFKAANFIIQITTRPMPGSTVVDWVAALALDYYGTIYMVDPRLASPLVRKSASSAGVNTLISGVYTTIQFVLADGATLTLQLQGVGDATRGQIVNAQLNVPSTYHGRTSALCGNFNGNPNDDLMKPDGTLAALAAPTVWSTLR